MSTNVRHWWKQRDAREQRLLATAMVLVGATLLWWWGLAPALRNLHQWQIQAPQLAAHLQAMRGLQAEVQGLQAQPPLSATAARQALEATLSALDGKGTLSMQGTLATVTLRGASAQSLANWLARARSEARLAPNQASLARDAQGLWNGTLQLPMPTP